jgi:uncharacterized protein
MIEIEDLSNREITELLQRVGYAHLGCCRDDKPYVVPVHYAYSGDVIYIYTTEGKKFEIIKDNPNVCLQIEEVEDDRHWTSVIVEGTAEQLVARPERELALAFIVERNPSLTPAISVRWMDSWVRENIEVIYKVNITMATGRRAANPYDEDSFVPRGPVTPA